MGLQNETDQQLKKSRTLTAIEIGVLAAMACVFIIYSLWLSGNPEIKNRMEQLLSGTGLWIIAVLIVIFLAAIAVLVVLHAVNANRLRVILLTSGQDLREAAERDDLTNLFNRSTAIRYIDSLPLTEEYTIMMLNIDHFKDINEVYGHDFGDNVLKEVAAKLQEFLQPLNAYIARSGSDEFVVVMRGSRLTVNSEFVVSMRDIVHVPIHIGTASIIPTVCIGVSYSDGKASGEEILVRADIALREAKRNGRANVYVFTEEMQQKVDNEVEVKRRIQEAMKNDLFYMLYQPKVSTETLEVVGYEALVRMRDSEISPAIFIPVAEENGWLREIGRVTTEKAICQIGEWKKAGKKVTPVSINFSSVQIRDTGYFDFLIDMLHKYDVPPEMVEIEITEHVLFEFTSESIALLNRLHTIGIRLLMDDFGTGYSSLSYLTNLPLDVIKIDKSFLNDNIVTENKRAMMEDIIQLGHDLGMEITIEGVETRSQYDYMKEMHADTIQGFFFSKPLPPDQAISFKPMLKEA